MAAAMITFHLPWLHQFLSMRVCAYNFTAAKGPAHAWHTHTHRHRERESAEDMLKMRAKEAE